jgi:hypothetical protein
MNGNLVGKALHHLTNDKNAAAQSIPILLRITYTVLKHSRHVLPTRRKTTLLKFY